MRSYMLNISQITAPKEGKTFTERQHSAILICDASMILVFGHFTDLAN